MRKNGNLNLTCKLNAKKKRVGSIISFFFSPTYSSFRKDWEARLSIGPQVQSDSREISDTLQAVFLAILFFSSQDRREGAVTTAPLFFPLKVKKFLDIFFKNRPSFSIGIFKINWLPYFLVCQNCRKGAGKLEYPWCSKTKI